MIQKLFAAVIAVALLPYLSFADTHYVAKNGTDSTSGGSAAQPWRTIKFALDQLEAGDDLIIRNGVYFEGQMFVRENGEAINGWYNNVTKIRAENPGNGNVKIRGSFDVRGSFIEISGLEIRGYYRTITSATKTNPVRITTQYAHGLNNNDPVAMFNVNGMTQIDKKNYFVKLVGTTGKVYELYNDRALTEPVNGTGFGTFVSGTSQLANPGIAGYWTHHVSVLNNDLIYHGGGGINFNHSDWTTIEGNECYRNGFRNESQHSNISIYQPIRHADDLEGRQYGIRIRNNRCHESRNITPTNAGALTDGNGIIADDFRYSQYEYAPGVPNSDVEYASNNNNPDGVRYIGSSSAATAIDGRAPYPRPTLIENNVCYKNGGKGIHLFYANEVEINHNTCFDNTRSLGGAKLELSCDYSLDSSFINNIAVANRGANYAAGETNSQGIYWQTNLYWNQANQTDPGDSGTPPTASVYGNYGNVTGPGHLIRDPLLVDTGGQDYRLQVNSPAINAATYFGESIDFTGGERPAEPESLLTVSRTHLADVGAIEFQGIDWGSRAYRIQSKLDESGQGFMHQNSTNPNTNVSTRSTNINQNHKKWFIELDAGYGNGENVYRLNSALPNGYFLRQFNNIARVNIDGTGTDQQYMRWSIEKVGGKNHEFRFRNLYTGKYLINPAGANNANLIIPLQEANDRMRWYIYPF